MHKIAVLDLRILNIDRNVCNILVKSGHPQCCDIDCCLIEQDILTTESTSSKTRSCLKLIPIDHGLSIPDTLAVSSYELAWLSFDQAQEPFSRSTLEFISKIDVLKDIEQLESCLPFRPVCLRNMRISNILLKLGAANGLTLAQIGLILCRPDDDD